MIYLFDRLYIDSDHYIRNDQKKVTALLGPVVNDAERCSTINSDFGPTKMTLSVDNDKLAEYLESLVEDAKDMRVTIFTDDDTMIKIIAFVYSSILTTPSREFIKEMILMDKVWHDQSAGVHGHRDTALRHKGYDQLDVTNIDALIDEAMAITPKVTKFKDVRIEFTYAAYLNGTLSQENRTLFEQKVKDVTYDSLWIGQLIKTFLPLTLTPLAKEGMNLDTFTVEEFKSYRPEYFKIWDTSLTGDSTCFDRVTLDDWLAYIDKAKDDFGWPVKSEHIDLYRSLYADKMTFVRDYCLDPEKTKIYFCFLDLGKTIKINPQLWWYIAREHDNTEFMNNFVFNL